MLDTIHIGFSNMLNMDRVIAVTPPSSAPIKRSILEGRKKGLLLDFTGGKRTKAVIFTDSRHIVLSALASETIAGRLNRTKP